MSDIAMLVAEEYERRIKNSRKICSGGGAGGGGCCGGGGVTAAAAAAGAEEEEEIGFVSSVSAIAVSVRAKKKKVIGEEKMEIVKWVSEPKSQIGLAAFNGFFSA